MRRTFAAAAFALLVSCTASTHTAATRATPTPGVKAAGKNSAAVAPASAPEVRLFAGVQSGPGAVVQFCRDGRCTDRGVPAPVLVVKAGSVVTFAVATVPDQAALEVSGTGARRVSLPTGTLIAAPGRVGAGAHHMTLLLRWGKATATYAWDIVARS